MDDERLDQLFEQLKQEKIPAPPPNLESRVLREARLQDDDDGDPIGLTFLWKRAAALVGAVTALALGIGGFIGSVAPQSSEAAQTAVVREALALDVFDPHTGASPHQLLHHHQ